MKNVILRRARRREGHANYEALYLCMLTMLLGSCAIPNGMKLRAHHPLAGDLVLLVSGLIVAYGLFFYARDGYWNRGWSGAMANLSAIGLALIVVVAAISGMHLIGPAIFGPLD